MPAFKDLTGKKFGLLTVLQKSEVRKKDLILWDCLCICGNLVKKTTAILKIGEPHCGCRTKINHRNGLRRAVSKDLTGQRFGKLVALEVDDNPIPKSHYVYWKCLCDCGKTISTVGSRLTQKNHPVRSCGCTRSHGLRHTKENEAWRQMKARCTNPKKIITITMVVVVLKSVIDGWSPLCTFMKIWVLRLLQSIQ